MPNLALFDIDADGVDQGFIVSPPGPITMTLRLNPPTGVQRVQYQVFDPGLFDPNLGIAANPPRASDGAPVLVLDNGTTTGQIVQVPTPNAPATIDFTGISGSHSWLLRCIVNGGVELVNGVFVPSRDRVHERIIAVPGVSLIRDGIATETTQFEDDGWMPILNATKDLAVTEHIARG